MTIRIQQTPTKTKIQFVLPDDIHDGPVSAVGSFNDWRPGVHKLVRRSNGTRSVSVDVPRGEEVRFRYLGDGGVWFDDPGRQRDHRRRGLVRGVVAWRVRAPRRGDRSDGVRRAAATTLGTAAVRSTDP